MPKKHQMTPHLLDKYTNNPAVRQPTLEGVEFSKKGNRNKKKYDHMNAATRSDTMGGKILNKGWDERRDK